mmetsp:Transcript_16593/g.25809  ORF Transcript_16593/g.25809 Transcript_16593/m.25809 type:complete len:141 (-) Transcript_16593:140-562(-)
MAELDALYIFLWVVVLILTSALIFFSVHLLVNIIDLENDFLNPIDMCAAVNKLLIPEYITHFVLIFLFVIGGYQIEVLINIPLLILNIRKYLSKKHKLDPTRIYDDLERKKKETFAVLLFEVLGFFWYLYRFVYGLVKEF